MKEVREPLKTMLNSNYISNKINICIFINLINESEL